MSLGIITYLDIVHQKKSATCIAFPDETRYHDYRQQNRAVREKCYQHFKRPPERISGLSIEVFYSSCLYEHDSRENTKRQESSEYPLGSIFIENG